MSERAKEVCIEIVDVLGLIGTGLLMFAMIKVAKTANKK